MSVILSAALTSSGLYESGYSLDMVLDRGFPGAANMKSMYRPN